MVETMASPAERAAQVALEHMYSCIDHKRRFLLEAGAGAGKTYSLVKALRHLIDQQGSELLRRKQQVACITFTNVASDEIKSRTDGHPAILSSTIHAFCWSLIKNFQPILREKLPQFSRWSEKVTEGGGIGTRRIEYDEFGHGKIDDTCVSLYHDDVLALTTQLLQYRKFRILLVNRYPILLIDEYQDTDTQIVEAIKTNFLDLNEGPLIGFFGDHWQKIYGSGCGKIEHSTIERIGKKANFRSVPVIVNTLNRMRPELPQEVADPTAAGSVAVYHTNDWRGTRRTEQHWAGDLPEEMAGYYLDRLVERLKTEGWDFSPANTKILMLTHKVLAAKQGYKSIEAVFPFKESFIKKEDPHIAFFVDTVEPVCTAYANKRYGEMFTALGSRTPAVRSHADKVGWARDMDTLLSLRSSGTISAVLDHLKNTERPRFSESVQRREREYAQCSGEPSEEEPSSISQLRKLREVPYQEVIALTEFINERTPFSTKHGVKGAEFENVLVVLGRGWNQYDFNKYLEWAGGLSVPANKQDAFERNRNLFYVVCSRPRRRLALLFTQKLSPNAMTTLSNWFGKENIYSWHPD